jgi:hypothetical protein
VPPYTGGGNTEKVSALVLHILVPTPTFLTNFQSSPKRSPCTEGPGLNRKVATISESTKEDNGKVTL